MGEEVKMISSKVNQQKAKLIDIEASVTLQERSTSKLSEDVKKINGSVLSGVTKVEEKMDKTNVMVKGMGDKFSELSAKNDNFKDELTGIKSRFDSKANSWDRKADSGEMDKLNILVTDEVNRIKKEMKDNLKTKKSEVGDPDIFSQFVGKVEFADLESSLTKLSEVVTNIESKIFVHQEQGTEQLEKLNSAVETLKRRVESLQSDPSSPVDNILGLNAIHVSIKNFSLDL